LQKAKYPLPLAHDRCTHAAHNGRRARTRPRGRRSPQPPRRSPGARGSAVAGSRSALAPGLPAPQRGPGEAAASGRDAGPRGAGGAPTPTCGPKRGGRAAAPGQHAGLSLSCHPAGPRAPGGENLAGDGRTDPDGPGVPRGPLPISPTAAVAALTFFRGCHFIIFVQPTRDTSRGGLGAGGRRRAAATASHAASLHPLVLSPIGQTVFVFGSARSAAATTLSHGARTSRRPEARPGRSGACSPTRACEKAPGRSSGMGRRPLRAETHGRSCHRNPAGLLPSKPLLANSPLLQKRKRLDKQSNPHTQPGAIPKILGVFLVCKNLAKKIPKICNQSFFAQFSAS
jgi:hypothetical protein